MPCGGRAIRTRRPSRFQRRAQSCAAASPGSSPSASTITSRTSRGRSSDAKARGRKRRPGRMSRSPASRQGRSRCLRRPSARRRLGEAHHAAATRTEHHLRRIDRRLAAAVAGKKGAVNGDRRSGRRRASPAPPSRARRRPRDVSGRDGSASVEAAEDTSPRETQIGGDGRSLGRVAMPARSPAPPCCASVASASGSIRLDRSADEARAMPKAGAGRLPQAALAKGGDHIALIAAGMAAHEHLAVLCPN